VSPCKDDEIHDRLDPCETARTGSRAGGSFAQRLVRSWPIQRGLVAIMPAPTPDCPSVHGLALLRGRSRQPRQQTAAWKGEASRRQGRYAVDQGGARAGLQGARPSSSRSTSPAGRSSNSQRGKGCALDQSPQIEPPGELIAATCVDCRAGGCRGSNAQHARILPSWRRDACPGRPVLWAQGWQVGTGASRRARGLMGAA